MADRDFFDEDLVKQREGVKRIKMGPGDQAARQASSSSGSGPVPRPVSDLNLTGIVRHKEDVSEEVAAKTRELERLRHKQEELERQKRSLEELRQKQDDYARGKREMGERLSQSVVTLEKQELRTSRLVEMLTEARTRFKDFKAELDALDEDSWPEERFREELGTALTIIDNARMEYNKTMARIESVMNAEESYKPAQSPLFEDADELAGGEKTFMDWVKIGLAISLPLVVVFLIMLILLAVALVQGGWIG